MKTERRILIFAVALLCAAGCKPKSGVAPPQPPAVSVVQPVAREVVEWDEYIGRLESPESVEVRARVSGDLDQGHSQEGQEGKSGAHLFTRARRTYTSDR